MSKNVFAYFHELKDVDSRNEKKIREKKFGRGDLVTIERVDFRVKQDKVYNGPRDILFNEN